MTEETCLSAWVEERSRKTVTMMKELLFWLLVQQRWECVYISGRRRSYGKPLKKWEEWSLCNQDELSGIRRAAAAKGKQGLQKAWKLFQEQEVEDKCTRVV